MRDDRRQLDFFIVHYACLRLGGKVRLCCCSEVAAPRLIHFSSLIERAKKTQARLLRGGGGYGLSAIPKLPSASQCSFSNGSGLLKIRGFNAEKTNFSTVVATRFCVFNPFLENSIHVKTRLERITIEQETLESTFPAALASSHTTPSIVPMATHWARSTPTTKTSALAPVRPSSFRGSKNRVFTS